MVFSSVVNACFGETSESSHFSCSPSGGDGIIGDGLGPSLIDEPDNGLTLGVLNNGDDDLGSSSKSATPNNSFDVPFGASC